MASFWAFFQTASFWQVPASFSSSKGRVRASYLSNGRVMTSYGEFLSTNSPQLAANTLIVTYYKEELTYKLKTTQ